MVQKRVSRKKEGEPKPRRSAQIRPEKVVAAADELEGERKT